MATYIESAQLSSTILQAERKVDIPPELAWLRANNAALVKLSGGRNAKGLPIKKRVAINPEFKVLEKEPHAVWDLMNDAAGIVGGDLVVTVTDGTKFTVGDIIQFVSGEIAHVTSKAANVLTITRSIGPTAAGAVADATQIYIIGNAMEEYSAIAAIHMIQNRARTNYLQTFEKVFGLSRTLMNSEMYQGKKRPELRREAFLEFERQIDRAFKFGEPSEDLTGGPTGNPLRTTGGLKYWIDAGGGHVTTAAPAFTKSNFATYVRNAFEYGSEVKVLLASPLVVEMIEFWKQSDLRFKPSDRLYDIRVSEWATGQGEFLIVRDREFKNTYSGFAFGIDAENLAYRYLQNSDMHLNENVVRDGSDGFKDQYLAEVGLEVKLPETHSYLENITTYV